MAQFVGDCKRRAQPIILADGAASDGITKGSQFSKTYGKERNKGLLENTVGA